jgi:hypothetical protein
MGYATSGNPGGGTPATKPGQWWFHMITEELRKLIADAGLTPDYSNTGQVSQAVQTLLATRVPINSPVFTGNIGVDAAPSPWGASYRAFQMRSYSIADDANSHYQTNNAYIDSTATWRYIAAKPATYYTQNAASGEHVWAVAPTGTPGAAITWSNALFIKNNGQQQTRTTGGGALMDSFDCRAWVNFNGTGTVAIRAGGNATSITDHGVGEYSLNFTTAMPDPNYSFGGNAGNNSTLSSGFLLQQTTSAPAVGSFRFGVHQVGVGAADVPYVCVQIFR